ncbi:MAG: GGDEF domain-containing protein [Rhodoferax sp.]|nr:GGDEF domain-containing protein [Rhodoferax sp.]MCF8209082.1 GGDEF domain-containing protein [Rhodoferax sp.]
MQSFEWAPCFVTGLATVDEQHHRLVDVINQFGEMLMQAHGSSAAEIEAVFSELAQYAKVHFSDEEAQMEQANLDLRHIAHHKQEHIQFLQDVTRMHAGLTSGRREEATALLNFLTNWLAYHILGSDQLMAWLTRASAEGRSQEEAYRSYEAGKDPATATLLRAVNRLFTQVSERNRELFELNQTLETKVIERTVALSEANHRLENLAMTDVLTGLPNRRHALMAFDLEWQRSMSAGTPLACMMIDADGFKTINDSFGHDAGDEVLRQLSRCLRDAVRNDDMVCRLGGDEFFIICANTPLEGAMLTAEKVRQKVDRLRVTAGAGVWKGSISVGVAVRTKTMQNADQLLKAADEGVYTAKRHGRNCVTTVCLPGTSAGDVAPVD